MKHKHHYKLILLSAMDERLARLSISTQDDDYVKDMIEEIQAGLDALRDHFRRAKESTT